MIQQHRKKAKSATSLALCVCVYAAITRTLWKQLNSYQNTDSSLRKDPTLCLKKRINIDTTRRIVCEKKTTSLSLRNQDWRTVKSETENVNDLLTNIPTNDVTELHDLIYAGAKLVCEKIGILLRITERKSKPGWELRLESQIKWLRQQVSILKRNIKKFMDNTEKARQFELKKAWRIQPKNTSERRKTKKIPRQDQTI